MDLRVSTLWKAPGQLVFTFEDLSLNQLLWEHIGCVLAPPRAAAQAASRGPYIRSPGPLRGPLCLDTGSLTDTYCICCIGPCHR